MNRLKESLQSTMEDWSQYHKAESRAEPRTLSELVQLVASLREKGEALSHSEVQEILLKIMKSQLNGSTIQGNHNV